MSNIKKHQCPSCGGNLTVDNDKQIYVCAFCGSTYDYEYFREEQMHEMGETYLSRGEFMAAVDAFKFILKKNPHDFSALRGLMLASADLTNINELEQVDKQERFSYDAKLVREVIENAPEEDRGYFTEFGKVFSDKNSLSDYNEEIESLREEKSRIRSTMTHNDMMRDEFYITGKYGTKHHPRNTFIVTSICLAILLAWIGLLISGFVGAYIDGDDAAQVFSAQIIIYGIMMAALAIYNFIIVFPKVRKVREFEAANTELQIQSDELQKRITSLENEANELSDEIKRSAHEFVRKDRLKVKEG